MPPDLPTLIQQTLDGDTAAFDELVRSCRQDAEHVARRYLGGSADVEDVLQEAFSQAYSQLATLASPDRFGQWLRAIVRNRCISLLRSKRWDVAYDEVVEDGVLQIDATVHPGPEDRLLRREDERIVRAAIDRLSEPHRAATALHYLDGKSYHEIARQLRVSVTTIEGRLYRARRQLKEELLKMADIDHEALQHTIEQATKGLREDMEGLKQQLWAVQREEDRWIEEARSAAARTITQLPTGPKNPITWGIVGGYRLDAGSDKRRIAISSQSSIEDFLGRVSDQDIVRFAGLFGDPTAVAILRQLVFGAQPVDHLVESTGADAAAVDAAVDHLEQAHLVRHTSEDLVEPLTDAVTYFLTLVSAAHLYCGHNGQPAFGDAISRDIISKVAAHLADDVSHPPPLEAFDDMAKVNRAILLTQAIPLSLGPRRLSNLKAGEKLSATELNDAQREYLRAMLGEFDSDITDVDAIVLWIDPTHTGDDDHAHIVVESGDRSLHIDALMEDTARPGWY